MTDMNQSQKPFSIRIFLPDGSPDGVRVIEKSNWTGIGVVVPKSLLPEAKKRDEFSRTGVYVLVGQDDESELPTIYIGQGDPVRTRLEQHFAKKEFWTWAIFFVTRDDSLNKAHIGYIEAALYKLAAKLKRCRLDNQNQPNPSPLTEADAADMDGFLGDMLNIFPLIGLRVFEQPKIKSIEQTLLELSSKGVSAKGFESPQGFVVVAGSTFSTGETASIQNYVAKLRQDLKKQQVLVGAGDALELTQDYEFSSASTAAAAVLGASANGLQMWKDDTGRTLKEMQEQSIEKPTE